MLYIDEHQRKWEDLHTKPQFQLQYPNETVVRFMKGNFKSGDQSRVLDLGCGAGRHIVYLAKEGYQATGIDFSGPGLEFVKKRLDELSLSAQLIKTNITTIPFENESFDGVISFAVIYYFLPEDIDTIIHEIYRVLKPNGKAFIVLRSTNDKRYGRGQLIRDNTYLMTSDFSNEEQMMIHFFTEDEIRIRFSMFSNISIGKLEEGYASLESYDSDFLVTITK